MHIHQEYRAEYSPSQHVFGQAFNDVRNFLDFAIIPYIDRFGQSTGIHTPPLCQQFLLAIALQESAAEFRFQVGRSNSKPGPARGFWQFERGGGVRGVMTHPRSAAHAGAWIRSLRMKHNEHAVWRSLEGSDPLAFAFARLLLWTSPKSLPVNANQAWKQYAKDLWRPGKPHRETWDGYWNMAGDAVNLRYNSEKDHPVYGGELT